jgi:hypothetical protein
MTFNICGQASSNSTGPPTSPKTARSPLMALASASDTSLLLTSRPFDTHSLHSVTHTTHIARRVRSHPTCVPHLHAGTLHVRTICMQAVLYTSSTRCRAPTVQCSTSSTDTIEFAQSTAALPMKAGALLPLLADGLHCCQLCGVHWAVVAEVKAQPAQSNTHPASTALMPDDCNTQTNSTSQRCVKPPTIIHCGPFTQQRLLMQASNRLLSPCQQEALRAFVAQPLGETGSQACIYIYTCSKLYTHIYIHIYIYIYSMYI